MGYSWTYLNPSLRFSTFRFLSFCSHIWTGCVVSEPLRLFEQTCNTLARCTSAHYPRCTLPTCFAHACCTHATYTLRMYCINACCTRATHTHAVHRSDCLRYLWYRCRVRVPMPPPSINCKPRQVDPRLMTFASWFVAASGFSLKWRLFCSSFRLLLASVPQHASSALRYRLTTTSVRTY